MWKFNDKYVTKAVVWKLKFENIELWKEYKYGKTACIIRQQKLCLSEVDKSADQKKKQFIR